MPECVLYLATDIWGEIHGYEDLPRAALKEGRWYCGVSIAENCRIKVKVKGWKKSLREVKCGNVEYKGFNMEVPEEVNYIATCNNGEMYGYTDKPEKNWTKKWVSEADTAFFINIIDWEDSLERV